MGAPKAYPSSYGLDNGDRDPKVWAAHGGHYGHSQVPENLHGDPGAIDPLFVRQTAKVPASPPPHRVLYLAKPMFHGPDVADVARYLNRHGYHCGLPIDVFGGQMDKAVRLFQHDHHLPVNGHFGGPERHVAGLPA